jgi:broad specificity phosphatase PhoE
VTRILLIRHGENVANLTREFSHRKVDHSLTPRGVRQADATARALATEPIAAVFSSPLRRALETAAPIAAAARLPVVTVEEFREINVGSYEGMPPTEELWAQHDALLAAWREGAGDLAFPEGENWHALSARVSRGLEQVVASAPGGTAVVVAHGGIIEAIIAMCPRSPETPPSGVVAHNCSITEIQARLEGGKLRLELVRWDRCEHLGGVGM